MIGAKMIILTLAIILQLTAAILALRQMGGRSAYGWAFIAVPLLFMGTAKAIDLAGYSIGINMEVLSLLVGASMFLGLVFITRIFRSYQQNLNLFKSIQDIDRVMLSSLSYNGVINAIIDKINQTLRPDAVGIYKYDKQGRKLNVLKTHNLSREFQAKITGDGNELIKSIIENRRTLIIDKFADDEDAGVLPLLRREGFTSYLGTPIVSKGGAPIGAMALYLKKPKRYSDNDIDFVKTMGSQIAIALDREQFIDRIHEMNFESVYSLVQAIEMRDPYTRGHSLQVAKLASAIAEAIGFTGRDLELVKFAGLLHDVGKIAVPECILQKPSFLTSDEWKVIQLHPRQSATIIDPIKGLRQIRDWVLYHHERWDGRGYPKNIRGDRIPIQSRILSVCDTFSAMTEDRPYRKRLSDEEARTEIRKVSGSQLDPKIANIFLDLGVNGHNGNFINTFSRDTLLGDLDSDPAKNGNSFSQNVLNLQRN
ncbi:MAG: HD domain-containing protein [candidate division WOR-3 bacterium]|nr:MAG: HD domain-containing protein [candidate division WOR-3 bacterium]